MARIVRVSSSTATTVFFVMLALIIILAGALIWVLIADDASPAGASDEELATLQRQIDALTAENQDLTMQLESIVEEDVPVEEPETEPEPVEETPEDEPALSGEIDLDWTVTFDERLERVDLVVDNQQESTADLTYEMYWEGLEQVTKEDDFTVRSGRTVTEVVYDGSGFPSLPTDNIDTLILEVRDSDGDLIDRLTESVR